MKRIIAVTNIAGGVGKTTTACNFAVALARHGKRVLVVDLDPQANATTYLGTESDCTIAEALDDPNMFLKTIGPSKAEGVSLAHGSIETSVAEMRFAAQPATAATRLRKALRLLNGSYDHILIDAPPAPGLLTVNAIVAADELLIPVETKPKALEGVGNMRSVLADIVDDPDLMPGGRPTGYFLATRYDGRTTLDRACLEGLRADEMFPTFKTVIRINQRIPESYAMHRSVLDYDPASNGALDYAALAEEYLSHGRG